jgi:hypothetical protein
MKLLLDLWLEAKILSPQVDTFLHQAGCFLEEHPAAQAQEAELHQWEVVHSTEYNSGEERVLWKLRAEPKTKCA